MTRPQDNFNWDWSEFQLILWLAAVLISMLSIAALLS